MPNTTIELRQSGSTGNTPSLGVLANGELAINRADGILYYKSASNTLGSIRTTQPAGLTTEVQFNDAGSFGSTSQVTINKATGEFRATTIKSTQSSGDEGGQIDLATAATNSSLLGGFVNIDIYQNRLRIFEAGGTNRGVYIDMANSAAAGVGSDLLGTSTIAQAAFNRANTANITADASFARANAANVLAQAAFNQANNSLANTGTSVIANGLTRYTFANTTPSTSKTTGALTVAGGVGVAGNVSTLGINVDNRIDWPAAGFAQPSFTNRSAGQKITLYPAISGSLVDYSIGIDGGVLWTTVPAATTDYSFRWYGGESQIASLSGTGTFTTISANIIATTASISNSTGAIISNGGLGVKGNVYADAVYDGGIEVIFFANQAFTQANSANVLAQAAFDKANSVTQQGFVTVAANGTNVVADANNDTLTLSAANGVGIFANATTDAITINLTPTGVTSGTYANATHVPVITVDTFGRLTSVSNTIIQSATTSQNGIVRLNDTITSTSTTQAGTANSVNNAYVTAVADALAFAVALG